MKPLYLYLIRDEANLTVTPIGILVPMKTSQMKEITLRHCNSSETNNM